jgi:hypothetical protein
MARKPLLLLVAVLSLSLLAGAAPGANAAAKKRRVTACVIKKGEDKGLMRFAPRGKCKRGEKKLTWNKKGRRGPRGEQGPAGGGGGGTNPLVTQLSASVSSLCSQLSAVTNQLTAVQSALAGLGLNSVLTTLGGAITVPAMPPALGPYACP